MDADRWNRIEGFYHAALEHEPGGRAAFLVEACPDADLRREVESLLGFDGSGDSMLEHPAWSKGIRAGERVGPYEILDRIGKGGMGEVWRARDSRLNREVAIKISAQQFSDRFEREARSIAALNHSNICTLFDVGPNYLVMELVEGATLAERIAQGPMLLDEALAIARQIADALEAAHENGIVHRDLKPANIKIRPDGSVKVLDFGLAKSAEPAELTSDSPTMLSAAGMILGTAAYMAPEQARGKVVDKRADIWAFGVVLYEMLTGKRPFEGETTTEILSEVIKTEPSWNGIPPQVQRLLKSCLEKDPKKRLRDIGDAWRLLEEASPVETRRSKLASWAVAVVAIVLALALGALVHFRKAQPVAEMSRFQIPLPATDYFGMSPQEVSPDGRMLAFLGRSTDGKPQLWIRSFDSLDARLLPGIEPDAVRTPEPFFWSSDSRFIAFRSSDDKLKKVNVSGGPAQTLCDVSGLMGGSWSRDGVILFGDYPSGVMRVSEAGGTATALTALDPARQETEHAFPRMLPDGRHFLYFRTSRMAGNRGIYVGAIDLKPSEQSSKPLLVNDVWPEYYVPSGTSDTGHLLFFREGTVLAQAFNPNKLELSGDPVPVAEHVANVPIGFFSASTNGVLTYIGGNGSFGLNVRLTWFDRAGKNLGTVGEPVLIGNLALSRDGKQAAVTRYDPQSTNLWLIELTRGGAFTRFTFDTFRDFGPVFSPDGSRIVFASNRDGHINLYQKLTSGVRNEELLLKSDEPKYPTSWSLDGRFLLYTVSTSKAKGDVWILPMDGSRKPMLFHGTEFDETEAQFSPDGRWIAYDSDESGRDEVYVREFSLDSDGKPEATGKHQISNGGGLGAHWRDDGKELFYLSSDNRTVMSAEITSKPVFQSSLAKPLFRLPEGVISLGIAVIGDGKRFLVEVPVGESRPLQFTVVQNWQAGLKK